MLFAGQVKGQQSIIFVSVSFSYSVAVKISILNSSFFLNKNLDYSFGMF